MAFNANMVCLIQFLNMGTQLRRDCDEEQAEAETELKLIA